MLISVYLRPLRGPSIYLYYPKLIGVNRKVMEASSCT